LTSFGWDDIEGLMHKISAYKGYNGFPVVVEKVFTTLQKIDYFMKIRLF
jgi:hypothetical protein